MRRIQQEKKSRVKLWLGIFIALVLVLVLGSLVFLDFERMIIHREIKNANYCEVKEDCVRIESKCPFDCYVFVNKDEAARVSEIISSYESKCVYGCAEPPEFDCVNWKCVWSR